MWFLNVCVCVCVRDGAFIHQATARACLIQRHRNETRSFGKVEAQKIRGRACCLVSAWAGLAAFCLLFFLISTYTSCCRRIWFFFLLLPRCGSLNLFSTGDRIYRWRRPFLTSSSELNRFGTYFPWLILFIAHFWKFKSAVLPGQLSNGNTMEHFFSVHVIGKTSLYNAD